MFENALTSVVVLGWLLTDGQAIAQERISCSVKFSGEPATTRELNSGQAANGWMRTESLGWKQDRAGAALEVHMDSVPMDVEVYIRTVEIEMVEHGENRLAVPAKRVERRTYKLMPNGDTLRTVAPDSDLVIDIKCTPLA